MKKWVVLAVCAAALLLTASRPAHALWIESHVVPGVAPVEHQRLIQVQIKDVRGMKEYRIVIRRRAGQRSPIYAHSRGSLYINPDAKPVEGLPTERGQSVPMKETRGKDTVTYTFRVAPDQLPRLRFEFHDSRFSSPEIVGGGEIYWFNLQEWASPQKPAAS